MFGDIRRTQKSLENKILDHDEKVGEILGKKEILEKDLEAQTVLLAKVAKLKDAMHEEKEKTILVDELLKDFEDSVASSDVHMRSAVEMFRSVREDKEEKGAESWYHISYMY